MIVPVLAGLFAALCWGVEDFVSSGPSRKVGQYRTSMYVLLFSCLTMLPALLYEGIGAGVNPVLLLAVALAGIGSFLGYYFSYRSFKYGDIFVTAPITSMYPVVVVVASVFILGYGLSTAELVSIAAILAGVALLSTKMSRLGSRKTFVAAGVGSAIVACVFSGVPEIAAGAYIAAVGFALFCVILRLAGMCTGLVLGRATGQDLRVPPKDQLAPIIAVGVLDGLGMIVFMYGISVEVSAVSIISALSGFLGGVAAILGFVLLKEKPEKNQIIGMAIAVIGAAALSYLAA